MLERNESHPRRVLLLPVESVNWQRAHAWSYTLGLAHEEGLTANRVECTVLPSLEGFPSLSPRSWLYHAPRLLEGRTFDQAWIWLNDDVHDAVFWDWLAAVAPIRVGVIGWSLEYTAEELRAAPDLLARRDTIDQQLRGLTHALTVDEYDARSIRRRLGMPAAWMPCGVPARAVAASDAGAGDGFGKDDTDWPAQYDALQREMLGLLPSGTATAASLERYASALRTIRRGLFARTIAGLSGRAVSVHSPSALKAYAPLVVESMTAGVPVVSWDIPHRPDNRALFEPDREIRLFDRHDRDAQERHLRDLRAHPEMGRAQAAAARDTIARHHTIEAQVARILTWIDTGAASDEESGRASGASTLSDATSGDAAAPRDAVLVSDVGLPRGAGSPGDSASPREATSAIGSPSMLFLPGGYRRRDAANVATDRRPHSRSGGHDIAARLTAALGCTRLIDVGGTEPASAIELSSHRDVTVLAPAATIGAYERLCPSVSWIACESQPTTPDDFAAIRGSASPGGVATIGGAAATSGPARPTPNQALLRQLDHRDDGVDHLAQVVRRDVRGHADGDAGAAVDEEIREWSGKKAMRGLVPTGDSAAVGGSALTEQLDVAVDDSSVILSVDWLERQEAPDREAARLARLVGQARGGLIVSVARDRRWGASHLGYPPPPEHRQEWTADEIAALLNAAGVDVVHQCHVPAAADRRELTAVATIVVSRTLAPDARARVCEVAAETLSAHLAERDVATAYSLSAAGAPTGDAVHLATVVANPSVPSAHVLLDDTLVGVYGRMPFEDVRRWMERVEPLDGAPLVIFGLGLGYHALSAAERSDSGRVLVIEPFDRMVRAARTIDATRDAIDRGRIEVVRDWGAFSELVRRERLDFAHMRFAALPVYARLADDAYATFVTLFEAARAWARAGLEQTVKPFCHEPGMSVVISTYNRHDAVQRLIEDLAHQRPCGVPVEVLLVNDDGDTAGFSAIRDTARGSGLDLRLFDTHFDGYGLTLARNIGLRFARYDTTVFLDDDLRVAPDLLWQYRQVSASTPAPIRSGRIDAAFDDGPVRRERPDPRAEMRGGGREARVLRPWNAYETFLWGGNCAVTTELGLALGGFDETFLGEGEEDTDFGARAVRATHRPVAVPGAWALHEGLDQTTRVWLGFSTANRPGKSRALLADATRGVTVNGGIGYWGGSRWAAFTTSSDHDHDFDRDHDRDHDRVTT